jgi:hypothetical protein
MNRIRRAAVLLLLVFLPLVGAEIVYRVYLQRMLAHKDNSLSYHLTPSVYVEYDERHGERLKPSSECWVSYVEGGRLIWGTTVSRSNRDGLGGRTTLAELAAADTKVLVFGDSFTHWNQGGVAWPDLLEDNLRRASGKNVRVADFARGAYGVLQMLDLAADEAEELHPDLIVIAVISHDFQRARWWCKEIRKDGFIRWMLSSRKDEFLDYRYAADEMLISPAATHEWCQRRLAGGGAGPEDPVLAAANAQFAKIRDEVVAVRRNFHPFALDRSYLLRRIVHRDPFDQGLNTIPQVSWDDFAEDARTRENLRRLRATGIPLLFLYLPNADEMRVRQVLTDRQTRRLMASLERLSGQPLRLLQKEYQGSVPAKMNLLPYDAHPNRDGLQLYADAAAPLILNALPPAAAESRP